MMYGDSMAIYQFLSRFGKPLPIPKWSLACSSDCGGESIAFDGKACVGDKPICPPRTKSVNQDCAATDEPECSPGSKYIVILVFSAR
jgi:hypothetical protein